MARRRGVLFGAVVGSLALLVLAGCGDGISIDRSGAESTGTTQSMETSAAVVAAEELAFLSVVRPERELIARVSGVPTVDDPTLLAYGYGVCRHASQTGDTWREMERNVRGAMGEVPRSDESRALLLLIRAARISICG